MPALCDVSLLLALATNRHVHHSGTVGWLNGLAPAQAVICRHAQLGMLRLLNNPAVLKEEVMDTNACWQLWRKMMSDDRFEFAATEPVGLEAELEKYTKGRQFTPKLWSDAYLAAFAGSAGLTLVTFDRDYRKFPGLRCQVL